MMFPEDFPKPFGIGEEWYAAVDKIVWKWGEDCYNRRMFTRHRMSPPDWCVLLSSRGRIMRRYEDFWDGLEEWISMMNL